MKEGQVQEMVNAMKYLILSLKNPSWVKSKELYIDPFPDSTDSAWNKVHHASIHELFIGQMELL
jgi:hypothetical protein